MKKLYIAPEMEIKRFSVEDIMTTSVVYDASNVTAENDGDTAVVIDNVDYATLFQF